MVSTCSPDFDPQALRVVPVRAAPASPAARAFQLQLARIERLQQQLAELDQLAQAHRLVLQQRVHPLEVEHRQRMSEMALLIDLRLAGKALSAPQRRAAVAVLCGLCRTLVRAGDAAMAALHDRHAPLSLANAARARAQALRAELEAALGGPVPDLPIDASDEEVVAAGHARLREQAEAQRQARRDKAERRKASQRPAAAQSVAQAQRLDADTMLRSLFRQLASALHPDRESDPAARLRKTELMGEANAAYARQDLLALLQLQQRAALVEPGALERLANDQLATMTLLLKRQVADLERERVARHDAMAHEFDLAPGRGVTPKTLQMAANEQQEALEEVLSLMRQDFALAQDDAGFKRWLKAQGMALADLAGG